MNLYALRHKVTKKLVGFVVTDNGDAEFCNSTSVMLTTCSEDIWVTQRITIAEWTVDHSENWYNSDMERPINPYVGQLEVVEFSEVA